MRPTGSDRLLLTAFAVLAVTSVGLKAAAGSPQNERAAARSGRIEAQLVQSLRSQGFATQVRWYRMRSALVLASRGDCRLAARNANGGTMFTTIFASDAAPVGPIRYLYRGSSYASPPVVAMSLGHIEDEARRRFGMAAGAQVAIALAASPGCEQSNFGLEDLSTSA